MVQKILSSCSEASWDTCNSCGDLRTYSPALSRLKTLIPLLRKSLHLIHQEHTWPPS